MSRINLLPWREELQEKKASDFLTILGLVCIVSVSLVFVWVIFAGTQLDHQNQRNLYLAKVIADLDEKVTEIRGLKIKKQEIITRIKIIQDLQGTRFEIVKMFDVLVRALPKGTYLAKLEKKEGVIKISGFADTNNRISTLMRNLDKSHAYKEPSLVKVEKDETLGSQGSKFDLLIQIQTHADENSLIQ